MKRKERCGELEESLAYAFLGDGAGDDDGGEFEDEGALLTAAAITRRKAVVEESTDAGPATGGSGTAL